MSARNAQDSSLRLYLCVLLRRHPLLADTVVMSVGGDKFFSVYIPELGVECKCVGEGEGGRRRWWEIRGVDFFKSWNQ